MKNFFSFLLVSLFLLPIMPALVSCGESQGGAETSNTETDSTPDSTKGGVTTVPVEELLVDNVYNIAEAPRRFKLFGNRMVPMATP